MGGTAHLIQHAPSAGGIGHGQDALLTAIIGYVSTTNVLFARSTAMAPSNGAVAVGRGCTAGTATAAPDPSFGAGATTRACDRQPLLDAVPRVARVAQ